jgi:hypothetical protein
LEFTAAFAAALARAVDKRLGMRDNKPISHDLFRRSTTIHLPSIYQPRDNHHSTRSLHRLILRQTDFSSPSQRPSAISTLARYRPRSIPIKMRLQIAFLLLAFIVSVLAVPPTQKPVVISYPDNTPSSVIDKAIEEIKKAGGIITHEYCKEPCGSVMGAATDNQAALIKGFSAKVSEATLNKISTMAEAYAPYIEEDYVVQIDGSTSD